MAKVKYGMNTGEALVVVFVLLGEAGTSEQARVKQASKRGGDESTGLRRHGIITKTHGHCQECIQAALERFHGIFFVAVFHEGLSIVSRTVLTCNSNNRHKHARGELEGALTLSRSRPLKGKVKGQCWK